MVAVEPLQQRLLETGDGVVQRADLVDRGRGAGVGGGCRGAADKLQIRRLDHRRLAQRHGAEDDVLQLPHIAGPRMRQQRRCRRRPDARPRPADLCTGALQKHLRQRQDVLGALAQRRHLQLQHVEPEQQILPERARGHHVLQRAVGGADDAQVRLQLALAADAPEAAVVEEAQQLGLQIGRHLAHLVEEERAAVRQLQQPRLATAQRAGEGAAGIAEQLALGQALGQRGAVQREEGLVPAAAAGVAGVGDQLLAGARLAADQQRRIHRRHARGALLELADRGRVAQDRLEAARAVVAQRAQPLAEAVRRVQGQHRAGHRAARLVQRHRFEQVGLATELHLAARARRVRPVGQARQGAPDQRRLGQPAGADRRCIGHDHHARGIDRQHRVFLRRQQRVQVQAPPCARQHRHRADRLHACHAQQLAAQLLQPLRVQRGRFEVDVRRLDLDRGHVQRPLRQRGEDFLGDADPVGEEDVNAHVTDSARMKSSVNRGNAVHSCMDRRQERPLRCARVGNFPILNTAILPGAHRCTAPA